LCTEVTDAIALLNITVHVVDVKCGVAVWRDGFERDITQGYGDFDTFLKKNMKWLAKELLR
jgi:TolB-like protein